MSSNTLRDVTQYRERLFRYAYRRTRAAHVAEDLVQEAFCRWYQDDRSGIAAPYAWLLTVVNRLCVEHWRRSRREVSAGSLTFVFDEIPPDISLEQWSDVVDAISVAIRSLNAEQRAAIILRDVFGRSYAEVSATLNKSYAASRQLVHRARVLAARSREESRPCVSHEVAARFMRAIREEDATAALELVSAHHNAA